MPEPADDPDVCRDDRSRGRRFETDDAGEFIWENISKLADQDLSDPAHFEAIAEQLDLIDFIDYCLIYFYAGGEDWALVNGNNMRAYCRNDNHSKLKFQLWDADSSFASGWKNETVDYPLPMEKSGNPGSFVNLFRQLMKSDQFRQLFASRVEKWCTDGGVLSPTACKQRYKTLLNTVEPALIAESARWGDIHTAEA